jgi:hypothetical protein
MGSLVQLTRRARLVSRPHRGAWMARSNSTSFSTTCTWPTEARLDQICGYE